jgi:hypothetical protein
LSKPGGFSSSDCPPDTFENVRHFLMLCSCGASQLKGLRSPRVPDIHTVAPVGARAPALRPIAYRNPGCHSGGVRSKTLTRLLMLQSFRPSQVEDAYASSPAPALRPVAVRRCFTPSGAPVPLLAPSGAQALFLRNIALRNIANRNPKDFSSSGRSVHRPYRARVETLRVSPAPVLAPSVLELRS